MIRPTVYRGRPGFSVGAVFCRYRATAAVILAIQGRRSRVPFTPVDDYWRSRLFLDKVLESLLTAEREPASESFPAVRLRAADVTKIGSLPAFGTLCDSAKRPLRQLLRRAPQAQGRLGDGMLEVRQGSFRCHLWSPPQIS